MANPDRLSGLDASFLSLERSGAHMHVGSVLIFDGDAPRLRRVRRADRAAAAPGPALPPEARVPAALAEPAGVDRRPALQRALPRPPHRAARARGRGGAARLAGRVFAQGLDRSKPLWEMWLVDRVGDDALRVGLRRPTTRWSTGSPAWTSRPCCSTSSPIPPEPRAAAAVGAAAGAEPRRAAGRRGRRARGDAARRRCAASTTPRGGPSARSRAAAARSCGLGVDGRRGAGGRAAQPAQRARSARTGASRGSTPTSRSSRRSRARSAGPSTTSC